MQKLGKKIFLLLAVFTVIAHSILPHIHLDDIVMVGHHHDHENTASQHHEHDAGDSKKSTHHLFSFAKLDEDFLPSKSAFKALNLPLMYRSPVVINYFFDIFPVSVKQIFGRYKEYPPPGNYFFNLPSRAPPAFSLS